MARFRKSVDLSAYENRNRKKPPSLAPRGKQNQPKRKPRLLAPRGRAISEGAGFIIPKHNEDLERREYEEKRRTIRRQSQERPQQQKLIEQQRQQQLIKQQKQAQKQAQQRQQQILKQQQAQKQSQQKSIEQQRNIEERKPINPVDIDQVQKQFLDNYSKEENKQKVRKTKKVSSQEPKITEKYQNREQLIEKLPIREEINHEVQIEDIPNNDFVQTQVEYKEPPISVDDAIADFIPNYQQDLAIEVNNVSLSFKVRKERIDNFKEYVIRTLKRNKGKTKVIQALDNVSFKLFKGEKIGIIGYNGAGKSTLLKVIAGVYKPQKGNIKVNGRLSPLLGLNSGFDPNFPGRDNIFFNGAILGYNRKFLESQYNEIVEFSELGEYINIRIKNYSSGMMAKLGFSIAAMVNPDILIIDEVLGVGDINFRKKVLQK